MSTPSWSAPARPASPPVTSSAGLAVSHQLSGLAVEHVVLERERIGQSWRGRWESFASVTPNWSFQLPGGAYPGDDPDGYMLRDEIVRRFPSGHGRGCRHRREGHRRARAASGSLTRLMEVRRYLLAETQRGPRPRTMAAWDFPSGAS